MRQREIDNLFRKKLEGFGTSPSGDAWKQIENNIRPEKVGWMFYVSIAASLLLVAVISIIIFYPEQKGSENILVDVKDSTENNSPVPSIIENTDDVSLALIEESKTSEVEKSEVKTDVAATEKQTIIAKTQAVNNSVVVKEQEVVAPYEFTLDKTSSIANVSREISTTPVALTANFIDVERPDINSEDEKSRGINLKKMIDLAKNLKTDNNSWSTLRDAKNELLTFGRKKDQKPEEIEE